MPRIVKGGDDPNSGVGVTVVDATEPNPLESVVKADIRELVETVEVSQLSISGSNAIKPPYDPAQLNAIYQSSAHLRPPIDAMVVNTAARGHVLVPGIDLGEEPTARESAMEAVRDALTLERFLEYRDGPDDGDPGSVEPVSDDDVRAALDTLTKRRRLERIFLDWWFSKVGGTTTWTEIRRRTRQDLEVTGNAYWEVIRGEPSHDIMDPDAAPRRRIREINHVPATHVTITTADADATEYERWERETILSLRRVLDTKHFRRFIQKNGQRTRYFKEFGDPRVISNTTGRIYASETALKASEPASAPANEMIHHLLFDSLTIPYGAPRWAGALLSVLGSKSADEVNLSYFHSKPPAGMLLVSGGKLSKQVLQRIRSAWEAKAKGKDRFHGLVIIEAGDGSLLNTNGSGKATIQYQPFTGTQSKDALFTEYDRRNADKIGQMFRLPPLVRGDTKDFNRATADAALEYAELAVFGLERAAFDAFVTNTIFPDLGITFWKFQTRGVNGSGLDVAEAIAKTAKDTDILTRREARRLWADAMQVELDISDA